MEAEEYKGRARSIIIGSLLKDIVDAATNINTAVGVDEFKNSLKDNRRKDNGKN